MSDCIFCKIIAGDIPSTTVYEDEKLKVIADINPAAPGHLLILPKAHAEDITALPDEALQAVTQMAKHLVAAEKEGLGADGVNLVQNNGAAAGQSVAHFHLHVIPRYENDRLQLLWTPTEPGMGIIQEAADKVRKALRHE